MAKARKRKGSGSSLPAQARVLFTQLERQYADATAEQWEELREHMHSRVTLIAAGDPRRRQMLESEFDRVKERTLAGQRTRQMRTALADGRAELVRDRGDGLEEWQVHVAEETLRLYVPVPGDHPGFAVAREALLAGRCASCRVGADIVAGTVEVTHNLLCPAKKALDT